MFSTFVLSVKRQKAAKIFVYLKSTVNSCALLQLDGVQDCLLFIWQLILFESQFERTILLSFFVFILCFIRCQISHRMLSSFCCFFPRNIVVCRFCLELSIFDKVKSVHFHCNVLVKVYVIFFVSKIPYNQYL